MFFLTEVLFLAYCVLLDSTLSGNSSDVDPDSFWSVDPDPDSEFGSRGIK